MKERAEALEDGDGPKAGELSKRQLHEHEREPDQEEHTDERDQEGTYRQQWNNIKSKHKIGAWISRGRRPNDNLTTDNH